ncbi:MAG: hypothetical protein R3292_11750 [Alcanivorax sp.]|nr:hypothetical protein [Alcanivorax sp.]
MPVFIRDYGVCLATGGQPRALLCAVLAGIPAVTTERQLALRMGSDNRPHFPGTAALPDTLALASALEVLLARLPNATDRVLVIVPDQHRARYAYIRSLLADLPGEQQARIQPLSETGLAQQLPQRIAELADGEAGEMLLLGMDSLLDITSLQDYADHGQLRSDKNSEGRALGEGLAWLVLSNREGRVQWQDQVIGHESCHGMTGPAPFRALATMLNGLADEQKARRPSLVIQSRAQTASDALEWHYTCQTLWPSRLSPRANLAMRKGELSAPQPDPLPPMQVLKPALALGELGAASLPMALVLACERMQWRHQPVGDALVVDAGEDGQRIAIQLANLNLQGAIHE